MGCLSKLIHLQINAINAATEAACLVLSVDETVKNPKVNKHPTIYIIYIYQWLFNSKELMIYGIFKFHFNLVSCLTQLFW